MYISKEVVLHLIEHNDKVCHYADERYENVVYATTQRIYNVVAEMAAANVQLVKHGAWRITDNGYYGIYVECSECGLNLNISDYISDEWRWTLKYCPCCGAKMNLKEGENNE